MHFFQWCLQEILRIAWDRHTWAFPFSLQFLFCNAGSKGCHTLPAFVALSPAGIQYLVLHLQILECLFRVCIIDFLSSRIFHYQKFIPNKHLHQKIIRNPFPSKTHSQARVVDLSQSSRQTLVSPIFRSGFRCNLWRIVSENVQGTNLQP